MQAGDVVVVLKAAKDAEGPWTEVRAPASGRLVNIKVDANDNVKVGDALFEIDTDDVMAATSDPEEDDVEQALRRHLELNQGQLQDAFLKDYLDQTDVGRIRSLALLLRDSFPQHRAKALTLLERVLELQQQKQPDGGGAATTNDIAQTHTDLGTVLHGLGDLDAALVQLQRALELRQQVLGGDEDAVELVGSILHVGALQRQKGDFPSLLCQFRARTRNSKEAPGHGGTQFGRRLPQQPRRAAL